MKHSIRSRNHTITGLVDAVLQHAGRQHAQSCVDENEPWSATDLHVGMAAARPSQEELQFCLAAAQHALRRRSFGQREREKHTVSVRTVCDPTCVSESRLDLEDDRYTSKTAVDNRGRHLDK